MKRLLVICLAALLGMGIACTDSTAAPKKKSVTTVFKTDIMCHNCVNKIMNNVTVLGKGIEDVKVDLEKKEVTVVYNPAKNDEKNIVKGFAKLKVKAEPKEQKAPKAN